MSEWTFFITNHGLLFFVSSGSIQSILIHPTNHSPQKSGLHRFWLLIINHSWKCLIIYLEPGLEQEYKWRPAPFSHFGSVSFQKGPYIHRCGYPTFKSKLCPSPQSWDLGVHTGSVVFSQENKPGEEACKWAVWAKNSTVLDTGSLWPRRGGGVSFGWAEPLGPMGKKCNWRRARSEPQRVRVQGGSPITLI